MHYGLHNLSPSPGSRKPAKRVGRGLNQGAMCGRGNAGQNSRSGPSPYLGFAGGTTPLWQRLPKLGRRIVRPPSLLPVSLVLLQHLLLMQRVQVRDGVVLQEDIFKGINASCRQGLQGIKIVDHEEGQDKFFDHRLCIVAGGFTRGAIKRVEGDLGGFAVSVHHTPASFRKLVHGADQGAIAPPMNYVERIHYSSYLERGYLNERVRETFRTVAPEAYAKYIMVPAMEPIKLPELPTYS